MTTNLKFLYPDIPFNSASITSNLSDLATLKKSITGPRNDFHGLTTRSYQDLWINYDLGSGITQAASHLAIADADKLVGDTVDRVSLRGSTVSAFSPTTLTGLTAWFDASRDVITNSDGYVSSWNDISGNSRHVTQSTAANKPVLSRGDNKENLFTYSEDFTNSHWNKSTFGTVTATGNSTTAPDGEITADTITAPAASGIMGVIRLTGNEAQVTVSALTTIRFAVYLKKNNYDNVWVGNYGDASYRGAAFNINTGTLQGSSGLSATPTITSVGNGWYRVSMTMTFTNTHGAGLGVWFNDGISTASPASQVYAGTEAFYIWGAQAQLSDRDTDYLATSAARKPGGVNGLRALHFDYRQYMQGSAASNYWTVSTKYIAAVIRPQAAKGVNRAFYVSRPGGLTHFYFDTSSNPKATFFLDGAGTGSLQSTLGLTGTSAYYIIGRHSSGTQYVKLYGDSETSGLEGNTSSLSDTFTISDNSTTIWWSGYICEMIVSNGSPTAQERADIETYLSTKWQATPLHQNYDLDATDLVGTVTQDYVETFTASSAYRYWWLQLGNSNTQGSDYRFSKAHFGTAFDFGRDPVWGRSWFTEILDYGVRRLNYNFSFTWLGITDAKVTEFITKIGKYKDVSAVWITTTSYHDVIGDKEAIYCTVTDYEITPESVNNNEITIEFEELI